MARRVTWLVSIAVAGALATSCFKSGGERADEGSGAESAHPGGHGEPDRGVAGDQPPAPNSKEQPVTDAAFSVDRTDGLPAELNDVAPLWEAAQHPTQRRAESVARLYPDGQMYRWGDTRRISVDGMPGQEPAPRAWRLEARITPEALATIEALIGSSFVPLAKKAGAPGGDAHGRLYTWRAHLGGDEYVVVTPAAAMDALPAPIPEIERAIQAGIVPGAVPLEQPKP